MMITEVRPIISDHLTPDVFEQLKANKLYLNWSYNDWLKKNALVRYR